MVLTVNSKIFARTLISLNMRSFMKIKPSRNGKITLSFIDIGKSCLSREFFTSLICLLMLFAKIKFSRKFPNLQYSMVINWSLLGYPEDMPRGYKTFSCLTQLSTKFQLLIKTKYPQLKKGLALSLSDVVFMLKCQRLLAF